MITVDLETDVLWLWDCGFDTKDISARCGITEADAERIVWRAREQRRVEQGVSSELDCGNQRTA
jgi:hypothetical protein